MLNSVNNPMDALDNIDKNFLQTVKGYLNNPLYSFLLPIIGINKQVALQKIESLERMMNGEAQIPNSFQSQSQTSYPSNPNDDLSKFRKGLNSF